MYVSFIFVDMSQSNHRVIYIAHYFDKSPRVHDVYQLPIPSKLERREIEEIILESERSKNREIFDIELLEYEVEQT